MYDAGRRALAAARELDQAARRFNDSKVPGIAPVVERANRRARRHSAALSSSADDLRVAAKNHQRNAHDLARQQGVKLR
jgi:hypothetical protein